MGGIAGLLPLMLLSGKGGGGKLFGKGMIRKVLMYTMMGASPLLFLMGGFSLMDFIIMPMIAPLLGNLGLGNLFGGGAATPAASVA